MTRDEKSAARPDIDGDLLGINRSAEPSRLRQSQRQRLRSDRALRYFAVNQLSTEHVAEAWVFSGQCGIDGDLRFTAERWGILKTGAPVLNNAVAAFDCRLIDSVPTGTHTVFVANVVAARLDPSREPLIYLRGQYARALAA